MARNRLVPLTDDLPESEGFPLHTCNWCDDKDPRPDAVMAVEHDGRVHNYYGVCGNHAEVLPVTTDWTEVKR